MRRLGVSVIVLVSALAACGGTDGSDTLPDTVEELTTTVAPEGRALADWQGASRAICLEYTPRVQAALAELDPSMTEEELIATFVAAVDLTLEYVDALRAIPVPTERTRAVERVNDRLDRGRHSLSVLRDSALSDDYGGFRAARGILINYADTDDLYRSLDVPECASPKE
jgi:hypothetical protein